jgi:hypothetical protein
VISAPAWFGRSIAPSLTLFWQEAPSVIEVQWKFRNHDTLTGDVGHYIIASPWPGLLSLAPAGPAAALRSCAAAGVVIPAQINNTLRFPRPTACCA